MAKTIQPARCYIAGPMRGRRYYNYPAFDRAAQYLRERDWDVISPADMDRAKGFDPFTLPDDHDWSQFPDALDYDDTMQRDLEAVKASDTVFVLEGWTQSKGAQTEVDFAIELKKVVREFYTGRTVSGPSHAESVVTLTGASAAARKEWPVTTGCLDYFPNALLAVARCSKIGNDQHNPGEPLHWDKAKSGDHADCLVRHLMDRGTVDGDGVPHTAKVAWRALALLEEELTGTSD